MAEKLKSIHYYNSGFSLIEVMIATAIFSFFIVSFMTGQGYNLLDSSNLKTDLKLKTLTQSIYEETILSPPKNISETLTTAIKSVSQIEDEEDFEYEMEIRKFTVPDLSKIQGDNADPDPIKTKILTIMKDNMEKQIFQLKITVRYKPTDQTFFLSGWINNPNAIVKIEGF